MRTRLKPSSADGELVEGSASTVIVVRNGTLIAPPNSTPLLPGNQPQLVENWQTIWASHRRDAPVTERSCAAPMEIWLAAATREVQPVTRLTASRWAAVRPGPVWRRIHEPGSTLKRAP